MPFLVPSIKAMIFGVYCEMCYGRTVFKYLLREIQNIFQIFLGCYLQSCFALASLCTYPLSILHQILHDKLSRESCSFSLLQRVPSLPLHDVQTINNYIHHCKLHKVHRERHLTVLYPPSCFIM